MQMHRAAAPLDGATGAPPKAQRLHLAVVTAACFGPPCGPMPCKVPWKSGASNAQGVRRAAQRGGAEGRAQGTERSAARCCYRFDHGRIMLAQRLYQASACCDEHAQRGLAEGVTRNARGPAHELPQLQHSTTARETRASSPTQQGRKPEVSARAASGRGVGRPTTSPP